MEKSELEKLRTNYPLILYSLSTIFMVFFSVSAIHNWPERFAQIAISLACIITTLLVLIQNIPSSIPKKNWPKELKLVLIIIFLGALNIYFSEDSSNYTDYIKVKTNFTEQKSYNDDRTVARKMVDAYESLLSNRITMRDFVELVNSIGQGVKIRLDSDNTRIYPSTAETQEEYRRWEKQHQEEVNELKARPFKGMSLFLMSGIMVFFITYFVFQTAENQNLFLRLCSICFIVLVAYGLFEFFREIIYSENKNNFISSNNIPASSLLILTSIGPLILLSRTTSTLQKTLLSLSLLLGVLIIILMGKRGAILALLIMALIWFASRKQGLWIFALTILFLAGVGYQFREKVPLYYKNQLLNKDTVLVRLEFYNVAWQIIKNKPFFGIGFNAPVVKYIPKNYTPKFYPTNSKHGFASMIAGVETFDNMALFFLGQTGLLFTGAYICLFLYLFKDLMKNHNKSTSKLPGILIIIVLIGFAFHSMTYDSLRYPHLNWMFHSLLGLIANHKVHFHQAHSTN